MAYALWLRVHQHLHAKWHRTTLAHDVNVVNDVRPSVISALIMRFADCVRTAGAPTQLDCEAAQA
jgi:hypothetical protein